MKWMKKELATKVIDFQDAAAGPSQDNFAACSTQSEYFQTFIAADIVTSIVEQNGYSVWRQKLTEHNFISAFF